MRTRRLLLAALVGLPLVACATDGDTAGPTPYDDEFPVSSSDVTAGAPDNDTLPDDNKADAVYPAAYQLDGQSPIKSQGSRGVCSIFATTALMENLYIKAGMPVAEADFSEQYLQWASKRLAGAFTYTEGSSTNENVRTLVTYGSVKESVWPYESFPWGAGNDAACATPAAGAADNRPVKCFTNGEPPAAATAAQKYKLPSQRYVNTNSMKAHMHTKKTGVNIGFTFFYQSWNHRKSTLPINDALWREGVVTYPNQDDKTESAKSSAGHAIHLIGWDDNKEFPMRDKDGKPVLDAQGNPRKEKGFWLFKNSWGGASFGVDNEYGPGYGWISYRYITEYGRGAVVAELPSIVAPAEVCDDGVGIDEDGDGQTNCDDADCRMHPSCVEEPTDTEYAYSATPATAIPDNNTTGVSSTITVTDAGTITDAKLTLDVSHTYKGDLVITLTKGDVTVTVHNRAGGATDDVKGTFPLAALAGKELAGTWTLKVVDTARIDTGTLNGWSLAVTAQ